MRLMPANNAFSNESWPFLWHCPNLVTTFLHCVALYENTTKITIHIGRAALDHKLDWNGFYLYTSFVHSQKTLRLDTFKNSLVHGYVISQKGHAFLASQRGSGIREEQIEIRKEIGLQEYITFLRNIENSSKHEQ